MAKTRIVRRPADDPGHCGSPRRELLVVHAPAGGALRVSGIAPRGGARRGARTTKGGGFARAGCGATLPGPLDAERAALDGQAKAVRGPRVVRVPAWGSDLLALRSEAIEVALDRLAETWGARRRRL